VNKKPVTKTNIILLESCSLDCLPTLDDLKNVKAACSASGSVDLECMMMMMHEMKDGGKTTEPTTTGTPGTPGSQPTSRVPSPPTVPVTSTTSKIILPTTTTV